MVVPPVPASMNLFSKAEKRVDNIRSDIVNILSKARIGKENIDKQDTGKT